MNSSIPFLVQEYIGLNETQFLPTTKECYEQYWTSPGGNTPQSSSYTATYYPSRKLPKLDEPDMQGTAGEAGMSS